jgi:hydroxyacylglutathione hydrolase
LGYERAYSPSLQRKPPDEWIADLLEDMPLSPPYFKRMKQVNRDGAPILGSRWPGQQRRSAKEVHERVCEDCLVVDTRSKEAYAAAHVPGSINIPLGNNLPTWAGWVLPYDRPILTIVDEPQEAREVATHLIRVGFDDLHGYLEGGIGAWETAGYELARLETMSVHRLHEHQSNGQPMTVVDVRTDQEWDAGHIAGALHVHGGILQDHIDEIPRDQPIAVVCGSGYRASIASSFLKRQGFEDVTNVIGGMSAWKAADLPTTAA